MLVKAGELVGDTGHGCAHDELFRTDTACCVLLLPIQAPRAQLAEITLVSMKGHEYSAPFDVLKYSKFIKDIVDQDPGAGTAAAVAVAAAVVKTLLPGNF